MALALRPVHNLSFFLSFCVLSEEFVCSAHVTTATLSWCPTDLFHQTQDSAVTRAR
jgi:hypothetical protein